MMTAVSCQCGSSDNLIRGKLSKYNSQVAMSINIVKGREKSISRLNALPQFPEINEIKRQIEAHSKWAIIIGYDGEKMKWVDLANGKYIKNDVDTELLVQHFA